jgi:hypothetical protein
VTLQSENMKESAKNPQLKKIYESMGVSLTDSQDFELMQFESHQAIVDYLNSPDYELTNQTKGLCFGFSVTEDPTNADKVDLKLAFSGQFQDRNTQSIPSQLEDVWNEFDINADEASFNRYTQQGYSLV